MTGIPPESASIRISIPGDNQKGGFNHGGEQSVNESV